MYEHVGVTQVFFPFFLKKMILLLTLAFSEMPILIYAFFSKVGHSCEVATQRAYGLPWAHL